LCMGGIQRYKGHGIASRIGGGNADYDRLVRRTRFDPLEATFNASMTAEERAAAYLEMERHALRQAGLIVGTDAKSERRRRRLERTARVAGRMAIQWQEQARAERLALLKVGEPAVGDGNGGNAAVQFNLTLPLPGE
jgi:hypothetical protein